jgi:DNA primase
MARYTLESRERVRDAVDFAEIVGARTELKRAGVNRLQGLCPFHEERTPSFGIDPTQKVYHCFGCSAGGDVFRFVMETESLDFASALEWLAERYRVPLEREAEDPQEAAQRQARERLLALLERTAAYYVRVLWESDEAARAREYLASRGLQESALREYRVGWAPDSWDRVVNASARAGYTPGELLAAGLAQRRRDGDGLVDRFRGRITFPLADQRGHVLGFGARAMKPGDTPKYLNTSESDLFHKSRIVYGADLARAAAAKAGRVVIVEGYTDVIALRQAGVPETVATMGTAVTDQQMNAIARLAPTAFFCQDPDAAGQSSVEKGIEALAQFNAALEGSNVEGSKVAKRIVRLPSGQDPADVIQRRGGEGMRELLDRAVSLERFQVERALELGDVTSAGGRDAIIHRVASAIARLGPSVQRDELVKLLSDRLGVQQSLVNEILAAAQTDVATRAGLASGQHERPTNEPNGRPWAVGPRRGGQWDSRRPRGYEILHSTDDARDPASALMGDEKRERAFLSFCLAMPDEGERILAEITIEDYFLAPATRAAAAYLRGRLRSPIAELPSGDEPLARLVAELVVRSGDLETTAETLEIETLRLELHRLNRQIAAARSSGEGDLERSIALGKERQRVIDEIRHKSK